MVSNFLILLYLLEQQIRLATTVQSRSYAIVIVSEICIMVIVNYQQPLSIYCIQVTHVQHVTETPLMAHAAAACSESPACIAAPFDCMTVAVSLLSRLHFFVSVSLMLPHLLFKQLCLATTQVQSRSYAIVIVSLQLSLIMQQPLSIYCVQVTHVQHVTWIHRWHPVHSCVSLLSAHWHCSPLATVLS